MANVVMGWILFMQCANGIHRNGRIQHVFKFYTSYQIIKPHAQYS